MLLDCHSYRIKLCNKIWACFGILREKKKKKMKERKNNVSSICILSSWWLKASIFSAVRTIRNLMECYSSYWVQIWKWNENVKRNCASFLCWWITYFSFLTFTCFYRADKGDSLKFSYLHNLDQLNGGAVVGEISRKFSTNENTLTVGCSYLVDPHTVMKAKLNNHGNLGALLQHELKAKSYLTISGTFDTKALERNPKFGLALSLKP